MPRGRDTSVSNVPSTCERRFLSRKDYDLRRHVLLVISKAVGGEGGGKGGGGGGAKDNGRERGAGSAGGIVKEMRGEDHEERRMDR